MRSALAAALLAALAAPASAQSEAPPGAASCSGCHSALPGVGAAMPPLFGRGAEEIVQAMRAYREETRPATVMNRLAKGFSEEETRAIATWIAAQPVPARP